MCVCVCWELFLKYAWTFNEVFKITSFPLLPFTCFSWSHLQNAFIDEDVYWIRSFRFLFGRITLISALPFLDKLLRVLLTFNHRLDVREVIAKKVWDFCDWEEKKPYECSLLWILFSGGSFISFDSHSGHGPIQFLPLSLCLYVISHHTPINQSYESDMVCFGSYASPWSVSRVCLLLCLYDHHVLIHCVCRDCAQCPWSTSYPCGLQMLGKIYVDTVISISNILNRLPY